MALRGLLVGGVVLMDGVWVDMSLDWVVRYADYPVGFIMESPLADVVVRIHHPRIMGNASLPVSMG